MKEKIDKINENDRYREIGMSEAKGDKKEIICTMKQLEETLQKMKQALKLDSIHIVKNGEEPKEIK